MKLPKHSFTLPPLLGLLFALLGANLGGSHGAVVEAKNRDELRAEVARHRAAAIPRGRSHRRSGRLRKKLDLLEIGSLLQDCAKSRYRLAVTPAVGRTIYPDPLKRLQERAR